MQRHDTADCPMARAVGLLGDRWTLLLVREAMAGASRYDEFRDRLDMSDNTLSRRLRETVELGLLEPTGTARRGASAGYRLTDAGHDLARVLAVLGDWSQQWFPLRSPRTPPPPVLEAMAAMELGPYRPTRRRRDP